MQANPFLTSLRAATHSMHKHLEESPVSKAIVSPTVTISNYIDYLHKVYAVHAGIEAYTFNVVRPAITNVGQRMKSPAIQKDLHYFSEPPRSGISFMDEHWQSDIAFNMGMMYVSEGSTLGGLYIKKNILASLGMAAQDGVHFLNVYGEQTGSLWKEFLEQLDAFQSKASPEEKEKIIAGAVYGFERTAHVFNHSSEHENKRYC